MRNIFKKKKKVESVVLPPKKIFEPSGSETKEVYHDRTDKFSYMPWIWPEQKKDR